MFILILFHPFHPTTYYLDAPSLDIPALYIGLRSSRLRAAAPLSIPSLQLPRSRPKSGLASSYLCCVAHETRLIYASPRALCMCEFVAQRCLPSCAAARTEALLGQAALGVLGIRETREVQDRTSRSVLHCIAAHGYPHARNSGRANPRRTAYWTPTCTSCLCRACCGGPVQRAT